MVLPAALVGACAGDNAGNELAACPPTQIAVPTDRIGHGDEDGRIRYVATMEQLSSSCRQDGEHVEVDIAFLLRAERGPAFEEKPVELIYYVATVDPSREIVDKQLLDLSLTLAPDQSEGSVREQLTLRLPLSSEASGANYSLYLGFQPDQQPGG